LTFPQEIPGANAPNISLPMTDVDHPERKMAAIDSLFPPPPASKVITVPPDRRMTLEELEEIALQNSPIIAQSLAAITMNQGTAIQQGIYPNPVFGYESDTVGSSFTRDYQGIYVSQLVKTAGKLSLQRAAANMDLMNSQLAYERTRLEILHMVRAGYYNVLVAQESMRINEALVRFTNQVYAIMIDRLKYGEQAGYELSQLQSLVIQARWTLTTSQNRYVSAWKQLAVATGVRDLPPAILEGKVEMQVPNLNFDILLERMLGVHPDVQASKNLESQSRIQLQLQRAIPIPDVTVAGALQNDSTTPGYQRTSYNLNVSVPVPIYDRNQGNILKEQGRLKMNTQQLAVTTNQLTTLMADAFERYQTARVQAEYSRTQVLPDLARAYRGIYEAHIANSETVAFGDIIVAQQNLALGVTVYITALTNQWIALTDIANLIQARDFREVLTLTGPDAGQITSEPPSPSPAEGGTP
jgi:cobalt-zinc-cadmium efflux system outer membrane protein